MLMNDRYLYIMLTNDKFIIIIASDFLNSKQFVQKCIVLFFVQVAAVVKIQAFVRSAWARQDYKALG